MGWLIGIAGFSGSMWIGVMYRLTSGSMAVRQKRTMPRTLPMPGLKTSSTQSVYSPGSSSTTSSWVSKVSVARLWSSATVMVNGMVASGPRMRERITLPLRRSTVCSPPVKAASLPSPVLVEKNPNVPWVPLRSGTHMPDSSNPLNFTGGKVIGTRWMVERMFFSPSSFQKAWLFWSSLIFGFSSGIMNFPMLSTFLAALISVDESIGE